jgi:hypothetical protein
VLTVPSANVSASPGQTLSASSLFSGSDADNDALVYDIYDSNAAANSGHFVVGGTVVPGQTGYTITAAQLAQTTFVAGAAGTSDEIYVHAFDGKDYSAWSTLHVNAGSSAAPASANALTIRPEGFIFAPDAGQTAAMALYQGIADNAITRIDSPPGHPDQTLHPVVTPVDASFGSHLDATVDPLGLFGMHAADHFGS